MTLGHCDVLQYACSKLVLPLLQVKVVELSDALESSGSYTKAEITQRVDKYRDKLMNVSLYFCIRSWSFIN